MTHEDCEYAFGQQMRTYVEDLLVQARAIMDPLEATEEPFDTLLPHGDVYQVAETGEVLNPEDVTPVIGEDGNVVGYVVQRGSGR